VSTNSCQCQAGYVTAVITEESQTTTQNLDCRPVLSPTCPPEQFVNDDNKCVEKSSCGGAEYCNGEGGTYDETLENCFCNNVATDPAFYCDEACEYQSLKVYYTKEGEFEMKAGGVTRTFKSSAFGEAFLFDGMPDCPIARCQITSQRLVDGQMVASAEASQDFVEFWKENINPGYVSPYPPTGRRRLEMHRRLEAYYFKEQ
jgi:hypothetical protein